MPRSKSPARIKLEADLGYLKDTVKAHTAGSAPDESGDLRADPNPQLMFKHNPWTQSYTVMIMDSEVYPPEAEPDEEKEGDIGTCLRFTEAGKVIGASIVVGGPNLGSFEKQLGGRPISRFVSTMVSGVSSELAADSI